MVTTPLQLQLIVEILSYCFIASIAFLIGYTFGEKENGNN